MKIICLVSFLLFIYFLTPSLSASKIQDEIIVSYENSTKFFKVRGLDEELKIKIIDEAEWDSIIKSKFSELPNKDALSFFNQNSPIDISKSLYLDTHWKAITSATSIRPILVTAYLYDCVGAILMDPKTKKAGLYHVHEEDKIQDIEDFIEEFIKETDKCNVNVLLVSGATSQNFVRCYEFFRTKNFTNIHCHFLKKIQLENNEIIFSSSLFNGQNVSENPELLLPILKDTFLNIAVDSQSMSVSLNFDADNFIKAYCHDMNMLQRAHEAKKSGMYIKFSE